jgi:hypothetical protein
VPEQTVKLSHAPTAIATNTPVPLRLGIYGEGGVGKTTLALSFPNPIVINTDAGLEGDAVAVEGELGDEWVPENWADLNALYFWLKAAIDRRGYKTIIIDSVDTLARFLLHEASDMATNARSVNQAQSKMITAEQQDYGKVALSLDRFLGNLKILSKAKGVHVVLTSGVREIDLDKGRERRTFDVQPAVESVILHWCNIYGEMEELIKVDKQTKEETEFRVLWTRASDPKRKCKTRFRSLRPGVKDPTFNKIAELITSQEASA